MKSEKVMSQSYENSVTDRQGSKIQGSKNFYPFPSRFPDEDRKLTQIFIFTLLCGASKGFMKALKAFINPFEVPQRSVKIKI